VPQGQLLPLWLPPEVDSEYNLYSLSIFQECPPENPDVVPVLPQTIQKHFLKKVNKSYKTPPL
jgi:hypothetical protein